MRVMCVNESIRSSKFIVFELFLGVYLTDLKPRVNPAYRHGNENKVKTVEQPEFVSCLFVRSSVRPSVRSFWRETKLGKMLISTEALLKTQNS